MEKVLKFYFSEIISKKIFIKDRNVFGKLKDLVIITNCIKPQVFAAEINLGAYSILVNFSSLTISKNNDEYIMCCNDSSNIGIIKNKILFLSRHILNKRIIDASGKKLQRINDLEIVSSPSGTYLLAVDIGIKGFLRKFKIEAPIRILLGSLGKNIPNKLLPWAEVEKVDILEGM